jgi:hypothetical protein
MKYTVKLILRHTAGAGETFIEESLIMLDAESFDGAYEKAEAYVRENGIAEPYTNAFGSPVRTEVVSYADCFSVYDDEDIVEVYSSIRKCGPELPEAALVTALESACTAEEMRPLRQFGDPGEEGGEDWALAHGEEEI